MRNPGDRRYQDTLRWTLLRGRPNGGAAFPRPGAGPPRHRTVHGNNTNDRQTHPGRERNRRPTLPVLTAASRRIIAGVNPRRGKSRRALFPNYGRADDTIASIHTKTERRIIYKQERCEETADNVPAAYESSLINDGKKQRREAGLCRRTTSEVDGDLRQPTPSHQRRSILRPQHSSRRLAARQILRAN